MKICTKCKVEKDLTLFSKDKQKKTGYSSQCKACKANYEKEYLAKNRAKVYTRNKEYNANHKDEKKIYDKTRRDINKELINSKKRAYYHDGGKLKDIIWNNNNRDKVNMYAKNAKNKRRELVRTSKLTSAELLKWTKEQVKVCVYCGTICEDFFHVDHIEPLSKGGKHELNNLTMSCATCNTSKGNKQLVYWLALKNKSSY